MKTITLKQYKRRLDYIKYGSYDSVIKLLLKILDKYKPSRKVRFNEFIKYNKTQRHYENNN